MIENTTEEFFGKQTTTVSLEEAGDVIIVLCCANEVVLKMQRNNIDRITLFLIWSILDRMGGSIW